jgi:tRNA-2-methylthio-N6-dimethylallyladenosine synthase
MADAVPEATKSQRLQVLLERQRAIQVQRNQSLVGQVFEVLVEGASRREMQWTGRTSSNRVLNFTSSRPDLLGEYVRVRVTGAGPNSLTGEESIE